MSGIEAASLALGILPLLIESVKAYSNVSKKLRTVRHYSREVKDLSLRLGVLEGIFLNEVRFLLRRVQSEKEVECLLQDTEDQRWKCKQLSDDLGRTLQENERLCYDTIEATEQHFEEMREELRKFDGLLAQKSKVSGEICARYIITNPLLY